jgi:hypothetical protein
MDVLQLLWSAAIYVSIAGFLLFIVAVLMGLRVLKPRPKRHLHKKFGIAAFSLLSFHAVIMLYFYFFT